MCAGTAVSLLPERRAPTAGALPAPLLHGSLADNVYSTLPQLRPWPTAFTRVAVSPYVPPGLLLTYHFSLNCVKKMFI